MSIYGGKELANGFRTVRKNTIQVAQDIPEDKYSFVSAPEVRSVARMLTHVAISTRIWEEVRKKRLTTLVGYDFFGMMDKFNAEEARPRTKAEILELLRTEGEQFSAWLETLTPEFLAENVTEPDGKSTRLNSSHRCISYAVFCLKKQTDRKSTRLNSSHRCISYAVFCLKKKKK